LKDRIENYKKDLLKEVKKVEDYTKTKNSEENQQFDSRQLKSFSDRLNKLEQEISMIKSRQVEFVAELQMQRSEIASTRTSSELAINSYKMTKNSAIAGEARIKKIEETISQLLHTLETAKETDCTGSRLITKHNDYSINSKYENLLNSCSNPLHSNTSSFVSNDDRSFIDLKSPQEKGF